MHVSSSLFRFSLRVSTKFFEFLTFMWLSEFVTEKDVFLGTLSLWTVIVLVSASYAVWLTFLSYANLSRLLTNSIGFMAGLSTLSFLFTALSCSGLSPIILIGFFWRLGGAFLNILVIVFCWPGPGDFSSSIACSFLLTIVGTKPKPYEPLSSPCIPRDELLPKTIGSFLPVDCFSNFLFDWTLYYFSSFSSSSTLICSSCLTFGTKPLACIDMKKALSFISNFSNGRPVWIWGLSHLEMPFLFPYQPNRSSTSIIAPKS